MTDHGDFCIVNVYVPNDGPGSVRLPLKMRFLYSLRRLLQSLRSDGRAVMLIGDLNISRRPQDVCWGHRVIKVSTLESRLDKGPQSAELRQLLETLLKEWDDIKAWLDKKTVRHVQITSSVRNTKLDRWRVMVPNRKQKKAKKKVAAVADSCLTCA